ncbi:MAG: hypothetical protein GXO50_10070 [Chlorobi bacterium]|nr:hypothetical protein [Chlorobiota bacterium]
MKRILFFLLTVTLIIIFGSCNRRVRYIYKEDQKADSIYVYPVKSEKYRLKPGDVLHIKIITTEQKINNLFKIDEQTNNLNQNMNGGNFYLSGFTVNDTGYVQIPVLGALKAEDKTVTEFRSDVTAKAHEYLKDAIVNVKLVSFKLSFLGEVTHKGPVYIYQDNIDILEAVSRAGGVTDYADMSNVTVVRNQDGKRLVYKLDLTNRNLLTSDKFYLYPDDIIIVNPLKTKIAKLNLKDYFFFFSALSSMISTTALIISIFSNN